jgi:hypothetical protein
MARRPKGKSSNDKNSRGKQEQNPAALVGKDFSFFFFLFGGAED